MKKFIALVGALALTACSGGSNSGSNETKLTTSQLKEITDTSSCKGPAAHNSAVGHSWSAKYDSGKPGLAVEHIFSIDSENQITVKAACSNGVTASVSSKAIVTSDKIQVLEKIEKLEQNEDRRCQVSSDVFTMEYKLVGQCLEMTFNSQKRFFVHREALTSGTPSPATPAEVASSVETPSPDAPPAMDFANSPFKGSWTIKSAKCGSSNSRTFREFSISGKSKAWTFGAEGEFWEITDATETCDRLSLIGKYTFEESTIQTKFDTVSFVPSCPAVAPKLEERKLKLSVQGKTMTATLESGPSLGFCVSGTQTLTLEKK